MKRNNSSNPLAALALPATIPLQARRNAHLSKEQLRAGAQRDAGAFSVDLTENDFFSRRTSERIGWG